MRKEILALLGKEWTTEWKQKHSFSGLLFYVFCLSFVTSLAFRQSLDPFTWNAIFWIIQVFVALNAASRSFMGESRGQYETLYCLVHPNSILVSKTIYGFGILLLSSGLNFFLMSLFNGSVVQDFGLFCITLILGSLGLSAVLTLISAISSRAGNRVTLMAILGFPVLIPLQLTILKLSKNAIDGLPWDKSYQEMLTLITLTLITGITSYLLFPYLWRD